MRLSPISVSATIGALGIYAGVFGFRFGSDARSNQELSQQIAGWPSHDATIVQVDANEIIDEEGEPAVGLNPTYRWQIDGVPHESKQYAPPGIKSYPTASAAHRANPELVVGGPIRVHVDPTNPAEAWVTPEGDQAWVQEELKMSWQLYFAAVLAMLTSVGLLVADIRRDKRALLSRMSASASTQADEQRQEQ